MENKENCKCYNLEEYHRTSLDWIADTELVMEKTGDSYYLTAVSDDGEAFTEISYCPLCGRKLNGGTK